MNRWQQGSTQEARAETPDQHLFQLAVRHGCDHPVRSRAPSTASPSSITAQVAGSGTAGIA
jgi:hypothetical protein